MSNHKTHSLDPLLFSRDETLTSSNIFFFHFSRLFGSNMCDCVYTRGKCNVPMFIFFFFSLYAALAAIGRKDTRWDAGVLKRREKKNLSAKRSERARFFFLSLIWKINSQALDTLYSTEKKEKKSSHLFYLELTLRFLRKLLYALLAQSTLLKLLFFFVISTRKIIILAQKKRHNLQR